MKPAILLCLIMLIAGNASGQKKPDKISAYEFRDSSSFMKGDRVRVYYFGDLILYEKEYSFDSSSTFITTDTLVIDSAITDYTAVDSAVTIIDSLSDTDTAVTTIDLFSTPGSVYNETRRYYIVHHRDSSYGITFQQFGTLIHNKRELLKNVLSGMRPKNQMEQLLEHKLPESSTWNTDRSVLVETYRFIQNADTPNIIIKMFYSSKMKDVPESLNPVVDSIKQLKFFRVEMQIDSLHNKHKNTTSPPMFFSFELKKIDVRDEKEILDYFDKYNNWRRRK